MHWTERYWLALLGLLCCFSAAACSHPPPQLPSGIPLPTLEERPRHALPLRAIYASQDGSALVTASADKLIMWRIPQLEPIALIESEADFEFARDLVVAPQGSALALLDGDGQLYIWLAATQQMTYHVTPFRKEAQRLLGFGPDNELVWLSSEGEIFGWQMDADIRYIDEVDLLASDLEVRALGQSPTGRLLWGKRLTHLQLSPKLQIDDQGIAPRNALSAEPVLLGEDLLFVSDNQLYLNRPAGQSPLLDESPLHQAKARPSATACNKQEARWAIAYANGALEVWGPGPELLVEAQVPNTMVREVYPRKILNLAFGQKELWLLLPNNQLVELNAQGKLGEPLSL